MDQSKITEILTNVLSQLSLSEDQIKIDIADDENINISFRYPRTLPVFLLATTAKVYLPCV